MAAEHVSELRLVLLGNSWSQRSSVGNLLLNQTVFEAEEEPKSPVRQSGEVQGKIISVINTPDLLQPDLTSDRLTELVTEIAEASAPGPHVFLLVLQPEDFTEQHKTNLESVLQSFSEPAFHRSLVLVTATEETSVMEECVDPPPLEGLIRKCNSRHQWVKSLESCMTTEFYEELWTNIFQIFQENNGKHVIYDIYEDATPTAYYQAKEGEGSILSAVKRESVLRILLFGKSDDKKTKMLKLICNKFDERKFSIPNFWKGRPIVVKTPDLIHLSVETVTEEMRRCVSQCSPGPNVLLLLVKPSNFSENDRKTLMFILSLFGADALKHSMVVLTHNLQKTPCVQKLIYDCGGRLHNMFSANHNLLTDSLKSIVDKNKASFLTLTEEKKTSLNLVLFGRSGAGKTSAAESIFGRAEPPAASSPGQCVKHQGEVCGRRVSLVELPALSGKPLEAVMQQCLRCISLCAPEGVHAFILVLPLGPLTDEDKAELKTIQDTLSSRVHLFTMILITVDSEPAPDVLQSVKGDIQELSQSCGGGSLIFNLRDQQKVSELLESVETLRTKNEPHSYDTEMLQQVQIEKICALQRENENISMKRHNMSPDCLRIVLIGKTGTGKSSSGNTILGNNKLKAMLSSTSVTNICQKVTSTISGRHVSVVDSPGLFDTSMSNEEVSEEMLRCVSLLAPGPHVFLLVLQIGQRLTKEEKETLQLIKQGFGRKAQQFTMILFTHGDLLVNNNISIQQYIENCDKSLQKLLSDCGNRYHVFDNSQKTDDTQVKELLQKIEDMVKENGGECYTNDMLQEAEAAIKKETDRLMKEKEEEMRKEREEMERQYQQQMEEMKQKLDKQREEFEKERQKREQELREKEEKIKEEKEQRKKELEKRKEEDRKRQDAELKKQQEWEQKYKEMEEKVQSEEQSKETFEIKLQESKKQMELEREQWEKERKERLEKRKQEDEEREQEAERRQKEIEQEKENSNKRLREDQMKLEQEGKKRKELEEGHQQQVEELKKNYEEKARSQAEEFNEFKESYRENYEFIKKQYMKETQQFNELLKTLWRRPSTWSKVTTTISKHQEEIQQLVKKYEEEIKRAINEEEKQMKQTELEKEKEKKEKEHDKELNDLIMEVKKSWCVIL